MAACPADGPGRRRVLGVTGLAGLFMTAPGLAALLAPTWFAHTAGFPDIPTLATARPLQGADVPARRPPAGPKHPLLHGLLVPLTHGLGRPRTGTTLHPSPHPTT